MVNLLLSNGVQVGKKNPRNGSASLVAAAGHSDPAVALHMLRLLVEHGADVNGGARLGVTALHTAAAKGRKDMCEYLLSKGARVDDMRSDNGGRTPLHYAVEHDHLEVVDLLLLKGADVNQTRPGGETLIETAMNFGLSDCAMLLMARGADPSALLESALPGVKESGLPAWPQIDPARLQGQSLDQILHNSREILGNLKTESGHLVVLKYLRGSGVMWNTEAGLRSLAIAALGDQPQVVRFLADEGIDVNFRLPVDHDSAAIHVAAARGHCKTVEALLSKGGDINRGRGCDEATPLFVAAEYGQLKMVKFLLSKGADVNQATKKRRDTPLTVASTKEHLEIVEVLLMYGGRVVEHASDLEIRC